MISRVNYSFCSIAGLNEVSTTPTGSPKANKPELPITPNYIQNPPFPYAATTATAADTSASQNGRPSSSPPRAVVSVTADLKELSIQSRTISTHPAITPSPRGKLVNVNTMGKRKANT